ncbi:MAG: DUF21 domain-containing protein, partial [Gemmatimonadota bacterium]|nr:DUF21 domain-containing protein [Gemmatimonadota bacterium]
MTDWLIMLLAAVSIAWLVAGATVVRLISRIWLRHWAERGLRGGEATAASVNRPQRLLASASVGIGLALAVAGAALAWRPGEPVARVAESVVICAGVVIFLAQLLARALARHWTAGLAPWTLPALRVAEAVAWPVLRASRAVRRAPSPRVARSPAEERAAVEQLLRESELEGVTARDDAVIITGVVQFADKRVGQVMIPRDQ